MMSSAIRPVFRIAGKRVSKLASRRPTNVCAKESTGFELALATYPSRYVHTSSERLNATVESSDKRDIHTVPVVASATAPAPVKRLSLNAQRIASGLALTRDVLEHEVGGDQVWTERVEDSISDLNGTVRKGRIGVYGSPGSGSRQVVTSLLTDPLTENDSSMQAILSRSSSLEGESFVTSYGSATKQGSSSLVTDSPWLRDTDFEITELPTNDTSVALSHLLRSDVVLLVLDPIRLLETSELRPILPSLLGKRNLYFIINGELDFSGAGLAGSLQDLRDATEKRLERQLAELEAKTGSLGEVNHNVLFLSAHKALHSMEALRSTLDPVTSDKKSRDLAFETFRKEYLESNLGAVSSSLLGDIRALRKDAEERCEGVFENSSDWVLRSATNYISRSLADVLDESAEIGSLVSAHTELLKLRREEIRNETFTSGEAIKEEMERVRRGVDDVLKRRLAWWKVLSWRVDTVAEEVGREVEERWAVELSQKLGFEAGKLHAIQTDLNRRMFDLLGSFSPDGAASWAHRSPNVKHPYHSPLFLNELRRLDFENSITPNTLLQPVLARRNQLLRFSIPLLQSRAHRMTWTTWSLAFLSSSAAWTAAVPLEAIEGSTGLAAGLLGSLASVRWGVGLWAKAQRKFWEDWERVEQGLEEDLGMDLERLVGQVEGVGLAGVRGVEEMVRKRRERVARVDESLRDMSPVEVAQDTRR